MSFALEKKDQSRLADPVNLLDAWREHRGALADLSKRELAQVQLAVRVAVRCPRYEEPYWSRQLREHPDQLLSVIDAGQAVLQRQQA